MKKLLALILSLITIFSLSVFSACDNGDGVKLSVYAPDGAPALSIARLINDKDILDDKFSFNVVVASTINTFVTGENPTADICIMPVNASVKVLGSGNTYKMLGTVTNGNLYLLKKQGNADINSTSDLTNLIGKTVGVINLANVPGLTFKAILKDNDIGYVDFNSGADATGKVTLKGLTNGTQVVPSSDCDYFVVPEPAFTTKINATSGALTSAGNLQALYGDGQGYPQAVVVAKNSVIENNKDLVDAFINTFTENKNWLLAETTSSETILSAITSAFKEEGTAPTFTANNLNKTVINNCAISFTSAINAKAKVLAYMNKINGVGTSSFGTPNDNFFYQG